MQLTKGDEIVIRHCAVTLPNDISVKASDCQIFSYNYHNEVIWKGRPTIVDIHDARSTSIKAGLHESVVRSEVVFI